MFPSQMYDSPWYPLIHDFSPDVLPGYLAGGISAENYVSQYILPKYPATAGCLRLGAANAMMEPR